MTVTQAVCRLIGKRDRYTVEHSKNVARLMSAFAKYAELSTEDITLAYIAGAVHDVGKISVPDYILNKPGRLTEEEFAEIKNHPIVGANILAKVPGLEKVAEIVRYHHEWYNGCGYGAGLSGEEIPFISRMLAVCDSFDAMTTIRCYRQQPLSNHKALTEIINCAGTQFDPVISRCFVDFIECCQDYHNRFTFNP
ncbi:MULTISPECIES: HD-GYP domain-containing protein [Sporomusa]|uniref:HD-GYP domain-containing protein n=1 Tax=Sporomusa TaxID=2375 RepID=UPI003158924D